MSPAYWKMCEGVPLAFILWKPHITWRVWLHAVVVLSLLKYWNVYFFLCDTRRGLISHQPQTRRDECVLFIAVIGPKFFSHPCSHKDKLGVVRFPTGWAWTERAGSVCVSAFFTLSWTTSPPCRVNWRDCQKKKKKKSGLLLFLERC